MSHSDLMTVAMRRELTAVGFRELRAPADVDAFMAASKDGAALVVVNSMCGCAAGTMRPAVVRALTHDIRPQHLGTVFAGQDLEATERARQLFVGYAPSSPAVALFKDGELVFMLERHQIQGRHPQMVADDLTAAFDRFCAAATGA
jgi:putative YphP/YqiW family bacilliredoxin